MLVDGLCIAVEGGLPIPKVYHIVIPLRPRRLRRTITIAQNKKDEMLSQSSPNPIALSVPAAVAYSGLSRSRLYELIRLKEIASVQVGGRRLVLRSGVDEFFAKLAGAA